MSIQPYEARSFRFIERSRITRRHRHGFHRESAKDPQDTGHRAHRIRMQQDVERAQQAGFDAHLTKPVNLQKLEAAIWKLLQDRQWTSRRSQKRPTILDQSRIKPRKS